MSLKENFSARPFVLLILDGWGLAKPNAGNAITLAKTPVMDALPQKYPFTHLHAHGQYVGLPEKQYGNSEAGHMNIGAGRIVEQDAVYITKCIKDKTFFKNFAFQQAIRHVKAYHSKMHIMGLLSGDESPHASPNHLLALLDLMAKNKVPVILHLFTDGRDSNKYAAIKLLEKLKKHLREDQIIATLMGRFYAMDRKKKWSRTKIAYEALTEAKGSLFNEPHKAIVLNYNKGESDEFLEPSIIANNLKQAQKRVISDNDAVIFFNLRSDRARQLTKAFVQKDFKGFKRHKVIKNLFFVAMTDFGPDLPHLKTAFPSRNLKGTLPMALKELKQLYLAESEKYAHVTYFFNGGYAKPVAGEERFCIPSPDVAHYDEVPAMRTFDLAAKIKDCLRKKEYDFIVCNFACPDMIGHTGNLKAGIQAAEAADKATGEVAKEVLRVKGTLLITADHGNLEEMRDLETGEIKTSHSTNPVPFILVNDKLKKEKLKDGGVLGNIAPTVLDLLSLPAPKEMKEKSLRK